MEKKNMIIIAIVVIIVAVIGVIFATGLLSSNNAATTPFDTEFMSGKFAGNVTADNTTNETYVASFTDTENNITYNLTTVDNSSALMEIYKFQGVAGPESRTFNGNDWNIYFGEAVPAMDNQTNVTSNQSSGVVICESQQENQGYVIYIIFNDLNKVNFTLNTYGEAYLNYVEPLLNSISLKKSSNVPAIQDQFGMSKDEFDQQIELIHQVNAGNYSAVQG